MRFSGGDFPGRQKQSPRVGLEAARAARLWSLC